MTRILVMSETMSLAAVKARFSELVDRVERQQDRVIVTRNGKPAAVLIN
jgi:antitoxin YefM